MLARRGSERLRKLLERHNWKCGICGLSFDTYVAFELHENGALPPKAATIDHIVPKSKGGKNHFVNLRPAHYKCNTTRGNKPR